MEHGSSLILLLHGATPQTKHLKTSKLLFLVSVNCFHCPQTRSQKPEPEYPQLFLLTIYLQVLFVIFLNSSPVLFISFYSHRPSLISGHHPFTRITPSLLRDFPNSIFLSYVSILHTFWAVIILEQEFNVPLLLKTSEMAFKNFEER